jgi:hypothetical protein
VVSTSAERQAICCTPTSMLTGLTEQLEGNPAAAAANDGARIHTSTLVTHAFAAVAERSKHFFTGPTMGRVGRAVSSTNV